MLKVWGRVNSINVQKVLWALEELQVAYERVDAGMAFGVVNEAFYKTMNPNARVPTIEDDGFVLWESNAIVRYLAAKHGAGTLWPTDLKQRADSDRWMDWISNHVSPVIRRCSGAWCARPPTSATWRRLKPMPRRRRSNCKCSSSASQTGPMSPVKTSRWATSSSASRSIAGTGSR